jgi:polysaccharide transporter, PST family
MQLLKNISWSIFSEVVSKVGFILANIVLARKLGSSAYGIFSIAQMVAFYIWTVVDFGTGMYGTKHIAIKRGMAHEIYTTIQSYRLISGIIAVVLATWYVMLFVNNNTLVYLYAALYAITYGLYSDWVFRGLEEFKWLALGSLTSSCFFLIGVLFFVETDNDLQKAVLFWSMSFLIGAIPLYFILLKKHGIFFNAKVSVSSCFKLLSESYHFAVPAFLSVINSYFVITLLAYMLTSAEVGIFTAPYRILLSILGGVYIISMTIYPFLSREYVRDEVNFSKISIIIMFITLLASNILAILIWIYSEQIVLFIFGNEYLQSAIILSILAWVVPLQSLRYILGTIIRSTHLVKYQWQPIFATMVIVAIYIGLKDKLELRDFAYVVLLSDAIIVFIYGFIVRRVVFINFYRRV